MKFDINKIPIKYIIGSYIDEPLFPTEDDVIYLMTSRANDKARSLNPVTFTDNTLFKKIDEKYHDRLNIILQELLNSGKIEKIKETKKGITYSIIKNPFL